jgi:hypothetical protein
MAQNRPISLPRFLACVVATFMLISIGMTLNKASWHQQLIPELDISRCPPLTSNTKRIWAYWHAGFKEMPIFVQQNIRMWKAVSPDWEIRVIQGTDPNDECHYSKFIAPEMIPKYFNDMLVQIQSDSVRLALMRVHGGVYMDSTILLLEPLEMNHWHHVDRAIGDPSRKALVGYYFKKFTLPGRKDGFEIWMLVAKEKEPLLVAWHDLYLKLTSQGPKPFIRNETTGELNPMFKGVNFSKIDEGFLNYGMSTTCLHALVQMNTTWNFTYEYLSVIRNADDAVYKLLYEHDQRAELLYDFFFNRERFSLSNVTKMIKNIPLIKLINHAWYITDENYDYWSNLHTNMGFSRINLVEKGRKWKKYGTWDYTVL